MCGSTVDIQSATAEIRREKRRKKKKKPQDENIMAYPIPYGGNKKKPQGKNIITNCDVYVVYNFNGHIGSYEK